MKNNPKYRQLHKDQRGLVAVAVTVFVMIILSLVVLAFSQISRREQQQALDRQLSTQAFYAAEAGINTKINDVRSHLTDATFPIEDNKCDDVAVASASKLDSTGVVAYSCVLYDKAPKSLEYGSITTETSEVISLRTVGNNLSKLTFTWSDNDGGDNFAGCVAGVDRLSFPKAAAYTSAGCDAGMLRLYFMPASSANREDLVNGSFTVFLRPTKDGSSSTNSIGYAPLSAGADTQANIVPAHCTAGKCTATISGLPGGNPLFLQMRSVYKPNSVVLTGTDTGSAAVRFTEAQLKIDVTGKASDVLRRLQVRVPIFERTNIPGYVIESTAGICKRLHVLPGTVQDSECASL